MLKIKKYLIIIFIFLLCFSALNVSANGKSKINLDNKNKKQINLDNKILKKNSESTTVTPENETEPILSNVDETVDTSQTDNNTTINKLYEKLKLQLMQQLDKALENNIKPQVQNKTKGINNPNQQLNNFKKELDKELKQLKKTLQTEIKEARLEIKNKIIENYNQEELQDIKQKTSELEKKYKNIKVLPVNSVISDKFNFKFDLPPVIKDGRTLIPVRAITEGLGATVDWDKETKKITITKDDKTIELWLGKNIALVNGEEVPLDTKPEILNSRTIVPVRFISETFNLKVNWYGDGEDTIEILEDAKNNIDDIIDSEYNDLVEDVIDENTTNEKDTTTEDTAENTEVDNTVDTNEDSVEN